VGVTRVDFTLIGQLPIYVPKLGLVSVLVSFQVPRHGKVYYFTSTS
jgi:hypothetical protein